MNRYQGVIFDLDGVLCSTDQFHYQAWKKLADEYGILFDETINNRLRGVSRMESLEIILENYHGPKLSPEEKIRMTEKKNEEYRKLLAKMSPGDLTEEVKTTLAALRKGGIRLAIGSSSKNTPFILERLGLSEFFDAVADGTMIARSKPDPEVFLKAAEFLELPAEQCLVVEDAKAGIEAAHRGGFDSVGIGEAAESVYATWPIKNMRELVKIVLEKE